MCEFPERETFRADLSRPPDFAWTELSYVSYVFYVSYMSASCSSEDSRMLRVARVGSSRNAKDGAYACTIHIRGKEKKRKEKQARRYEECISRSCKVSRWTSRSSRLERRRRMWTIRSTRRAWISDNSRAIISRIGPDCPSARACVNRRGAKGKTKILKGFGRFHGWSSVRKFRRDWGNGEAQRATKLIRRLISCVMSI